MSDNMIERVARAICKSRQWDEDEFWKTAIPDARAAIATIRDNVHGITRTVLSAALEESHG